MKLFRPEVTFFYLPHLRVFSKIPEATYDRILGIYISMTLAINGKEYVRIFYIMSRRHSRPKFSTPRLGSSDLSLTQYARQNVIK